MYPIVYQFKVTMEDYRKMSFFSTFSFKKSQNIFLLITWIAAFTAFLLDIANVIKLTQTIHLCALMVTVTMPMLLISVIINVHRFKLNGASYRKNTHTVLLGNEDVQYKESGNINTGIDKWDDIYYAFETKDLFLLYRTRNDAVLLPKRSTTIQQIEKTRACLKEKLGVRFKIRCKV